MLLALPATTSLAQTTNTWTGTTSADWNTATNWSQGRVPLTTDDVVIGTANNAPLLSTTAVANSVEVEVGASLSITSAGSLTINGSKNVDFLSTAFANSGTVSSGGQLVIGNTAAVGFTGLYNQGTFSNQPGGSIQIDRSATYGLYNYVGGSFTNSATLTIGANAPVGDYGLFNQGTFSNQPGGRIQIDHSTFYGLKNIGGSFTNSATMSIGANAPVGDYGLFNQGTFSNQPGGHLQIDRSTGYGLYNNRGSFTNSATLTIGANTTVGDVELFNDATFSNAGCGALLTIVADAVITNDRGSFTNTGTIIENASGNSNISYNAGLVQNLNNGTFTIDNNVGILTTTPGLVWTGCTSTDWNTPTNWSQGRVPLTTDDVVISAGPINQPVLSTTAVANSVEVQGGASLSIASTGSLTINGSKNPGSGSTAFANFGTVTSGGQLVIGNTASVGNYGLFNQGTFSNQPGGSIQIDRSTTYGLFNYVGGSFFTNSATMSIGANAPVGDIGLVNEGTFSNQPGGRLQIDRSTSSGLGNYFSSFTNSATLTIGANASVGQYGLQNFGTFSNQPEGHLQIDNSTDYGLYNGGGSFTNSATLIIGANAPVGDYGIWSRGTFSNAGCGALLTIVADAVITSPGSFSNTGTIIENASGNSNISYNAGLVQNLNNGTFTIDNNVGILTTTPGLLWTGCTSTDWNTATNWSQGRVPLATDNVVIAPATNQPVLSTTAVANSVEVQGGASLSIASTGSLIINGSKNVPDIVTTAFVNFGTVTSGGQLVIGNTASVGNYGLVNLATFSNQPGGSIQIDNSTYRGLSNYNIFTNSATLSIGANAAVGQNGLFNQGTFSNQPGGSIQIDNSTNIGLSNGGGGSFTNSATLSIGANASVGDYGLFNLGTFSNQPGGSLQIDRSTSSGLWNYNIFTNSATLTIGANAPVGATAVDNRATFSNAGCGALLTIVADAVISSNRSFSNTGTIIENASGNSNISYNGGLVQNRNGGTFTITNNAGILVEPLAGCTNIGISPALQIGTGNTLSVGTTWFADAALTTPVGTYSPNSLTLTGGTAGPNRVYFAVTDAANSCTTTASVDVSLSLAVGITAQPAAGSAVCVGGSVTASVSATGTAATPGGSLTYQWYKDGASLGVAQQTATLSLPNAQPSAAGSYSVIVTGACGSVTSTAFSLTVSPPPTLLVAGTTTNQITRSQNTGSVNLVASGCNGTLNWTGSDGRNGTGNLITVSLANVGSFVYQTTCSFNGCTSAPASATVTVSSLNLTVLYRNEDDKTSNDKIKPFFALSNGGAEALPLSQITIRYWLTVEDYNALNLKINNAKLFGSGDAKDQVSLRYVGLGNAPRQGAYGYLEYSFLTGAGTLGAGVTTGTIESEISKQGGGLPNTNNFEESDDYSYMPNSKAKTLVANSMMTAYRNGVLVWGTEPALLTPTTTAFKVLYQDESGDKPATAKPLKMALEVRNVGNVPVDYSRLTVRYWLTVDDATPITTSIDKADLGKNVVSARLVKLANPVGGADSYVELSFAGSLGQLQPLSGTGDIEPKLEKDKDGRFNLVNDYSYLAGKDPQENARITVYVDGVRIYGTEPSGSARLGVETTEPTLTVTILGNPVGETLTVAVTGAEGQPLALTLSDLTGRVVNRHEVEQAGAVETVRLSVGSQSAGLLLLRVSSPNQVQTVKVIKP